MNSRLVVDTSAVSTLLAVRPGHLAIERKLAHVNFVSAITIGELLRGAYRASWGAARVAEMRESIAARFVVLDCTEPVAEIWAELVTACNASGVQPSFNDAWIAATAVVADCPVVTTDRDFTSMARHYPALRVLP